MNRLSRGLLMLLGLGLLLGACGIKGSPRPPLPPPPPASETQPPTSDTQPPGQTPRGPIGPAGPGPQDAGP